MNDWREMILAMKHPIAQRYVFVRYVLDCTPLEACGIAGAFQDSAMDAAEYDVILARWGIA